MTLDEATAALAANLGEVDEDKIGNMSYIWFNDVLDALGKRLNYDSISNLYGNSFAKDAGKIIQSANPLVKNGSAGGGSIAELMNVSKVKVIDMSSSKDAAEKALTQQLGDISWAEGLF